MFAAFAFVIAQSCSALLPPAQAPIDWFRNGQPFARDEPVRASALERVYRRVRTEGGRAENRTLACVSVQGRTFLREQIGAASPTVLPLDLGAGGTTRLGDATIRRVERPSDASVGSMWFAETRFASRLLGLQRGVGIEEVRTVAGRGRTDVLRAVVAESRPSPQPVPTPPTPDSSAQLRTLQSQLTYLQRSDRELRDSLNALQTQMNATNRVLRDSLGILSGRLLRTDAAGAARLLADSAARLPSGDAAWAAGWMWPGAGHNQLDGGGRGWMVLGALAAATGVTALALPDGNYHDLEVDPAKMRRIVVAGSAGTYLLLLLVSHAQLNGIIERREAIGATRESFLRGAQVTVAPDGQVGIMFRRPVR